jgi:hypothetical protein
MSARCGNCHCEWSGDAREGHDCRLALLAKCEELQIEMARRVKAVIAEEDEYSEMIHELEAKLAEIREAWGSIESWVGWSRSHPRYEALRAAIEEPIKEK